MTVSILVLDGNGEVELCIDGFCRLAALSSQDFSNSIMMASEFSAQPGSARLTFYACALR
jgi:hypothetical protein